MAISENWFVDLTGEHYFWVLQILLIIICTYAVGKITNGLVNILARQASKSKTVWDDAIIGALRRPAVWIVWIIGVNLAASVASTALILETHDLVSLINRASIIFLSALFLIKLIKRAEHNLSHPDYMAEPLDETTVRAVGKLLSASVIIMSVLVAMQLFGYSISGLLAFGGIGGLAIGFAAKDLLANFFGGLMLYFDQPFKVGDWVRSPDQEIEGTVEDIGWRLTRIRTFDQRPLYIPNSVFNSISLENPSRMLNRRIFETIGIRYDDLGKMESIVSDVRLMLSGHDDIDNSQILMVNFNTFAASSADFFIYTFTKTTKWALYHQVKQDVLLKVSDIIAGHNAEIAFPTSTLHMVPDPAIHNDLN